MQLHHMPGPTDEARAIQLTQEQLADALYATYDQLLEEAGARVLTPEMRQNAIALAAYAAYQQTVTALEQLLGPASACCQVDSITWSMYSDLFKSEYGVRPGAHVTRAEALEYLGASSEKEV